MEKSKKILWKIIKIIWIITIALFCLVGIAVCSENKNKKETKIEEKKQELSLAENATPQERFEYYAVLSKPLSDFDRAELKNDNLHLFYMVAGWNEDRMLQSGASDHCYIMQNIFENCPEVNTIVFNFQTQFVDLKGNEFKNTAFRVTFTRQNAKDINYQNYKTNCTLDYNNMLLVADEYYIHPGIEKNLKNLR